MTYNPAREPRNHWLAAEFELESGAIIRDFRQSYIVHGQPEADGSNVILITASLGGDAHRLDFLIGAGLALDPQDLCIIATDPIGNGHSSSPSNSESQAGPDFPAYSIRDMVEAQRQMLLAQFGIEKFRAVVGASMGGMQALQWAVSHPGAMRAIVALVPLAKTPAWTIISNEISRRIIMLDPDWAGGRYTAQPAGGWRTAHGLTQVLAARSPQLMAQLCDEGVDPVSLLDSLVDGAMARGFDANDWLYQTRAYDAHDVGAGPVYGGDTVAALRSISVPALIMGPQLDLLNPSEDQLEIAKHIPDATFVDMKSHRGHMAANVGDDDEVDFMNQTILEFIRGNT